MEAVCQGVLAEKNPTSQSSESHRKIFFCLCAFAALALSFFNGKTPVIFLYSKCLYLTSLNDLKKTSLHQIKILIIVRLIKI